MSRLESVARARLEITKEALKRWKSRSAEREQTKRVLRAKGVLGVESADRVDHYNARRAIIGTQWDFRAERIIGADDRKKVTKDPKLLEKGRAVARIAVMGSAGVPPQGFGTGFMISDRLLMTNHHVLRNETDALGVAANFDHNFRAGGGVDDGTMFELEPKVFFTANRALDYAIVAVKPVSLTGAALSAYGFHPLKPQPAKSLLGTGINIIQHPQGGPKQYATQGNGLVDRLDDFLHYETDTEPGSSGSPCFNDFWDVVALHHSGVPMTSGDTILNIHGDPWDPSQGEDMVAWIANEGVRISKIIAHLKAIPLNDPGKEALLQAALSQGTVENEAASVSGVPVAARANAGAQVDGMPSAQTIVHVHGNATINTGTVHTHAAPPAAAPAKGEAASGLAVQERVIQFDPNYGRRRGYCSRFPVSYTHLTLPTKRIV